ncbi:MAG: hypothetical protein COX77_00730 [Candidatus Komeilibacteria bacterium CG_4_10_14_0_2_um_filter_37_10]|uniref:Septum formation initiator n=1 Tax=Candidatus Komeilibacteria bacterium CG_4_10_14_0_2_um_filter_37_10 TaxID=1974470 RepID=A0A2M7VGA2_9BACT|nr:MAG: hypothetical protein COX77_00730 [Candidatus Komeilibacteria bacterium CG_4_10_14_0_2_um_filter_37_10]PJA92557.1 MAG: hypothetical protein CO133_02565 [Candidatus Komeilibacteria bacterium CG_4_9_14_3_um_filter_37_5]
MKNNLFYKLFNSKVIIYLLAIIIILFIAVAIKDIYRQRDLRGNLKNINQQLADLAQEKNDLANLLNYVQSNDFVEEEARTKLNMRKPGEKVIIISNTAQVKELLPTPLTVIDPSEQDGKNWQRWLDYFFADK